MPGQKCGDRDDGARLDGLLDDLGKYETFLCLREPDRVPDLNIARVLVQRNRLVLPPASHAERLVFRYTKNDTVRSLGEADLVEF